MQCMLWPGNYIAGVCFFRFFEIASMWPPGCSRKLNIGQKCRARHAQHDCMARISIARKSKKTKIIPEIILEIIPEFVEHQLLCGFLSSCVCMYICVYMCIYIYVYIYVCTYVYIYICIYIYVYMYVYVYLYPYWLL